MAIRRGGGRGMNLQRAGLVVAVAVGLIGAGTVGIFAARSWQQRAQSAPAQGQPVPDATPLAGASGNDPAQARGVRDIGSAGRSGGTPANLAGASRARVQLVDRDEPTRVIGLLEWTSLEPLPDGRAEVSQPRWLIYQRDGTVVAVRAQSGRLLMPAQNAEPESGVFRGGVVVQVFRGRGGVAPDLARAVPAVTLRTESVSWDRALLELTTADAFTVESERVFMAGRGIQAVGNAVTRRLELLRIDQTERVLVRAGAGGPALAGGAPSGAGGADGAGSEGGKGGVGGPTDPGPVLLASAQEAPLPGPSEGDAPVTIYHVEIPGAFRAQLGTALVASSSADVWLRTIDGALPDGALGEDSLGQGAGGAPEGSPTAAADPQPAGQAGTPWWDEPRAEGVIRLDWQGPLTSRPLAALPELLRRDHVALRLSQGATPIALEDPQRSVRGRAGYLEYGATRRDLTLTAGAGDPGQGVVLSVGDAGAGSGGAAAHESGPGAGDGDGDDGSGSGSGGGGGGRLVASWLTLNLSSGVGQVRGPGRVERTNAEPASQDAASAAPTSGSGGTLAWEDQADFVLGAQDGWADGQIREATAQGNVRATDGRALARAESLTALFGPSADGDQRVLRTLTLRERVRTVTDADGRSGLEADGVTVRFGTAGQAPSVSGGGFGRSAAEWVGAAGGVRVWQPGVEVWADRLEATLGPGGSGGSGGLGGSVGSEQGTGGGPRPDRVIAGGGVLIRRDDGLVIAAGELDADVPDQVLRLRGLGYSSAAQQGLEEPAGGAGAVAPDEAAQLAGLLERAGVGGLEGWRGRSDRLGLVHIARVGASPAGATAGSDGAPEAGAAESAWELLAPRVTLSGATRQLWAFGGGELRAATPAGSQGTGGGAGGAGGTGALAGRGPGRLHAAWTGELSVSDEIGEAVAVGDVRGVHAAADGRIDEITCHTLVISYDAAGSNPAELATGGQSAVGFGPGGPAQGPGLLGDGGLGGGADGPAGGIRRVEAISHIGQGAAGTARVESRLLAALGSPVPLTEPSDWRRQTAGAPTERLLFLEGSRIIADLAGGTLDVPGAGRLLIDERSTAKAPPEASGGDGIGARGTSLFTWEGGLSFERAAERVRMTTDVRLRHRPTGDTRVLLLESQELTADLRFPQGQGSGSVLAELPVSAAAGGAGGVGGVGVDGVVGGAPGERVELRGARATGLVVAEFDQRQLAGDTIVYEPASGTLEATAASGGNVSILDRARSAPATARRIVWNLLTGRLELEGVTGSAGLPRP